MQRLLLVLAAIFAAAPAFAQTIVRGGTQPPTAVTAALVRGSNIVRLAAVGSFVDKRGIVIYGAGGPCEIGGDPCSHIVIQPPTAAVNGYAGAGGGQTKRYVMQVAACDANWGCTAASPPSAPAVAAPMLSEPHTAGASGNNVAWTVRAIPGAAHYVWWRSSDGGRTYALWRVTDGNSFVDWVNARTPMDGRWTDVPPRSVANDDFVSTVAAGGGTRTLTLAAGAVATGSYTAWPDDTAEIDAAYVAANAAGGQITCAPGFYKVRSISALPNAKFSGPFWDMQNHTNCVIYGTTGNDVFVLTYGGSPSPFGFEDISVVGGRNVIFVPPAAKWTPTYISIERLSATKPENAAIGIFASVEELYVEQGYFSGGRFGIDIEGVTYLQKSAMRDATFNAQIANGLYANTNTVVLGYLTFDRDIFQVEGQDALYLDSPIAYGSVKFSGLTTEADGRDVAAKASTASCRSGSADYSVTSTTGLAVGQDYTVKGCAASQMPVEGTICAIRGNTITLMDPTCTVPVIAGRTAAGQPSTNAIFDDIFVIGSVNVDSSTVGNAGRYSINGPAGVVVRATGFGGFGGLYDPSGSSDLSGVDGEWIRPELFYVFLSPGQDATSEALSGGYNAALHTTPRGGSYVVGLVDSNGNGSGTYGSWRIVKNDGNRSTLASVDSGGDASYRGNLSAASIRGQAATVAHLPTPAVEGMLVPVIDSATNVLGATITGGGRNHVLAYYDGTRWTVAAK